MPEGAQLAATQIVARKALRFGQARSGEPLQWRCEVGPIERHIAVLPQTEIGLTEPCAVGGRKDALGIRQEPVRSLKLLVSAGGRV